MSAKVMPTVSPPAAAVNLGDVVLNTTNINTGRQRQAIDTAMAATRVPS